MFKIRLIYEEVLFYFSKSVYEKNYLNILFKPKENPNIAQSIFKKFLQELISVKVFILLVYKSK